MNLKEYIAQDPRMEYPVPFSKGWFLDRALKSEQYYVRKYVRLLRTEEFYTFVRPIKVLKYIAMRKRNKLGSRIGFIIPVGCFGPDLKIAHYGSIIVNPHSKIGRGCTMHGVCLIGNKGTGNDIDDSPRIGNNVDIGQFAGLIGPITIADNITVGGSALVTKSFTEPGITLVGVPARKLEK